MTINRKDVTVFRASRMILAVSAWALAWSADTFAADKPNIIFILADDLGIDGVSCYGSDKFKTPNIDALASGGMRFEACYAAPLCGPSRCLLMTGRYAFRTGGLNNNSWRSGGPGAKSKDEVCIAKLLKQNGYATCQAGKWRQVGEAPSAWGFDEYLTDITANGWFWKKSYIKNGQTINTDKPVYCPDIMHEFAIDFINRNKDKPFFLYYAQHLVHLPMERTPDSNPNTTGNDALYADNITYMDKQVGLIIKELEKLKLREKTLIVFSGDNGTATQFAKTGTIGKRSINGHKGQTLEGGSRVPLVCNWPGVAPAGKVLKDLVDFSDMYATFAEVAEAKLPEGVTIDGQSYAPQLRGEAGKPREWVFVQLGAKWYVRSPGWKLNESGEFFDMKDAPFVEKPVAADTTDAAARAGREQLQKALASLNPASGKKDDNPPKKKKGKD
jgi:arylsulfatase A